MTEGVAKEIGVWLLEGLAAGVSLGTTEHRLSPTSNRHHMPSSTDCFAFGVGFAVAAVGFVQLMRGTLHNRWRRRFQNHYHVVWRVLVNSMGTTLGHLLLFALATAAVALPVPVLGFAALAAITAGASKELAISAAAAGGVMRPLWYGWVFGRTADGPTLVWSGDITSPEELKLLRLTTYGLGGVIVLFVTIALFGGIGPDAGSGDSSTVLLSIDDEDE